MQPPTRDVAKRDPERRDFLISKLAAGHVLSDAELEEASAIAMLGEIPNRFIGKLQPAFSAKEIRQGWDAAIARVNSRVPDLSPVPIAAPTRRGT